MAVCKIFIYKFMLEISDRVYIGIVVSNDDPLKLGRIKCNVIDIYENFDIEDIPWCSPTKDLCGQAISIPQKGKVVSIVFENNNIYTPNYIYAQHYDINLEEKLKSLSYEDYISMTALQFDDNTQVYVNESEGLKLDHKFNMINIVEDGINVNLKDNSAKLNLGTYDANQSAILGTNFLEWFDEFLEILLGSQGGAFIGNLMTPVITSPALIQAISKYKAKKDPKFLSKNVFLNDNGYINKMDRININQTGDKWTSTVDENTITFVDQPNFTSTDITTSKDSTPQGKLSTGDGIVTTSIETPPDSDVNPDILSIIGVLRDQKYKIYTRPHELNLVGVRYQYQGQEYSNKFVDKLYAVWKDDSGKWNIKWWKMSTIAGSRTKIDEKDVQNGFPTAELGKKVSLKRWCSYFRKQGLGILVPAQYVDIYYASTFRDEFALKAKGKQLVYRDIDFSSDIITYSTDAREEMVGIHLHKAFPNGGTVDNWSEGCQVVNSKSDLDTIAKIVNKHVNLYGNSITYTLITSKDVDNWNRLNNND